MTHLVDVAFSFLIPLCNILHKKNNAMQYGKIIKKTEYLV